MECQAVQSSGHACQEVVLLRNRDAFAEQAYLSVVGVVVHVRRVAEQVHIEVVTDEEATEYWVSFGLVRDGRDAVRRRP